MDKPDTGSREDSFRFLTATVGSSTCLEGEGEVRGIQLAAVSAVLYTLDMSTFSIFK